VDGLLVPAEDYHHRCSRLHLFQIVEVLRVGLFRRSRLLSLQPSAHLVLDLG
jgi:hypothetical protein